MRTEGSCVDDHVSVRARVSVSGGIDSAVTLGLMKHAMQLPDSPIQRVLGISQPIHSSQWAYDRAMEYGKAFGVDVVVIDQTAVFDMLVRASWNSDE